MLAEGALFWLALNVYHEARGEDAVSQRLVAHVTINRARQAGTHVRKVVKEPYQFSWTLDSVKLKKKPWEYDPQTFLRCGINSVRALAGKDITNGATHYHEADMRPYPAWSRGMVVTIKYGEFVFYKETHR